MAQAQEHRRRYGANQLETVAGRSRLSILIDQFKNLMLLMLAAVAVVSAVLDLRSHQFPKDTVAIALIIGLNGLLGYLQESRAEQALAALKQMASPRVKLIRQGRVSDVEAETLVPGDVILLEAGAQIPADGRLLEAVNLRVREAALTGEAQAVSKQAQIVLPEMTELGDRCNLIFQGTEIVQGRGRAIITETGMRTQLGQIAQLLQAVETEPTPLQRRMDQLSNVLVSGSLAIVALVVVGGLLIYGWPAFQQLLEVSLSMAVAVVPEGLPAVITVTLALGTQRMVKRAALIRRLGAVETLGSVTVICSDKTGTLTENKMVAQRVQTLAYHWQISGQGYAPDGGFHPVYLSPSPPDLDSSPLPPPSPEFRVPSSEFHPPSSPPLDPDDLQQPELQLLLLAAVLCNDALLQPDETGNWTILGDPTEGALLPLAIKAGYAPEQCRHALPRHLEVPFSSERKRMSVVCVQPGAEGQSYVLFTKGSPEQVLERCVTVQVGERSLPLDEPLQRHLLRQQEELASQGLRMLGFGYRLLETLPETSSDPGADLEMWEQSLTWLGVVGILDAARPEAAAAVAACRSAGIRTLMITGDHQLTARAIARSLGIMEDEDRMLDGRTLEAIAPDELQRQVQQVNVYARVAPEHKLRIVQALQQTGQVVAMTGDGVNDAPALKQADIGVAMGIAGNDVSKEASDMVLLDDNFATIVAATEEGRVVYSNIRRFIKYILGSNVGEVLTIAAAPLLGLGGSPLLPLQILWMNLVTDGLPALALAVEPAEPDVMRRSPVQSQESIFAQGLGWYILRLGVVFAVLTIGLMLWAFRYTHADPTPLDPEGDRWKTMVFTTLCIAQMGHAIAVRSDSQLTLELSPRSNPYVWGSVIITTFLQLLLIYVAPLRDFFGIQWLSPQELLICLGFSSLVFVWVELEKVWRRLSYRPGNPSLGSANGSFR